ncbi:MAG: amidohydrolase family protein [Planctomycetota bacterium]|nr:amidohydrolase family protein [Planctomycetota bacterium]
MFPRSPFSIAGLLLWAWACQLPAQKPPEPAKADGDIRELKLKDWQPRSMLKAKVTRLEKPMYPVVDVHNHLGGGKDRLKPEVVARYLAEMNEAGVRTVVNLDGGWGDRLKETVAALDEAHPGRFLTYALVDFTGIDDPEWGNREATRLEESFKAGAKGLKFHKTFGLRIRYKDGKLMPVDDPKLNPVWAVCAKHKRPVIIHIADPAAFFTPLDKSNERWHELNSNPGWLFYGGGNPDRQALLDQLHRVIGNNPKTTFINTHFGNNAEDLASVGEKLDQYPNMFVDFDARISELGRQPYAARRFFLKYQDRILFGTDTTPRREAFRIYYRFLETDDEYFDCSASHHLQGFWNIYGIFLPPEVLEKIYRKNAERILFGLVAEEAKPRLPPTTTVRKTADFEVTGNGSNPAWGKTTWIPLEKRPGGKLDYTTRIKLLYSNTGLYTLMEGTDSNLTATFDKDFENLWTEDVFEAFLWPEEKDPVYFEYEISPLGKELPIVVPNLEGKFKGWLPWHYEGGRKTRKATSVMTGEKASGAAIGGWKAEVFIPFALMEPMRNSLPGPGTRWRANFYRVDHDKGATTAWDWARVGSSFHDFKKFGTLVFE